MVLDAKVVVTKWLSYMVRIMWDLFVSKNIMLLGTTRIFSMRGRDASCVLGIIYNA